MTARKVGLWVLAAIMVYFVLTAPEHAATMLRGAVGGLRDVGEGGVQFLHGLSAQP